MKSNEYSYDDAKKDFFSKRADELKKLKSPTILVCGYTGTGKSSLIKAICGTDVISEDKIVHGRPGTMGYIKYKSDLVNFWDSQGFEPGDTEQMFEDKTRKFLRERQEDNNVDNHIHLIWYAIQGSGGRVTDCDIKLINKIFNPEHEIVTITKKDITRPVQMNAMRERLTSSGVLTNRIIPTADNDINSCKELMELSYKMLPDAYKNAFMSAQTIDLDKKASRAHAIIHGAATTAAGIASNPIPFSDAVLITPIQVYMIAHLAVLYNMSDDMAKKLYLPLIARAVGTITASSLLKFFPGLGNMVNAGVAFTLTEALGWTVQKKLHQCLKSKIEGTKMPEMDFDENEFKSKCSNIK